MRILMSQENPGSRDRAAAGERPGEATTIQLLARAREGDNQALDEVFARSIPPLKRWARGRLPGWARGILDTDDLVQETVIGTLRQINVFEYRADAALQAYLRQAVMNRIRNEIRRASRKPSPEPIEATPADPSPSPLEALVGKQSLEAYDHALEQLAPEEREAIIGRVELGLSYAELARAMDRPSPDAARMAVGRALLKLAKLLNVRD
jgi:RNA polymerase sigma factor (sigma-70 family)